MSEGDFAIATVGIARSRCPLCSEVGICDKIPQGLSLGEHLPEDLPMPLRWVNQSGTRLVNPALHSVNGLIEGQRLRKHPCVGADPDKR